MIHVELIPEAERMTVAEVIRYAGRLRAAQVPPETPVWTVRGGLTTEPA